jgi:hypothetical protein
MTLEATRHRRLLRIRAFRFIAGILTEEEDLGGVIQYIH